MRGGKSPLNFGTASEPPPSLMQEIQIKAIFVERPKGTVTKGRDRPKQQKQFLIPTSYLGRLIRNFLNQFLLG